MTPQDEIVVERAGAAPVLVVGGPLGSAGIARMQEAALDELYPGATLVIDVAAAAPLGRGAMEALDEVVSAAEQRGARLAIVNDPERPLSEDGEEASDALAGARLFESREAALQTLDYQD